MNENLSKMCQFFEVIDVAKPNLVFILKKCVAEIW